jgi:hypothetical protein
MSSVFFDPGSGLRETERIGDLIVRVVHQPERNEDPSAPKYIGMDFNMHERKKL